jgi:hypothetical protein
MRRKPIQLPETPPLWAPPAPMPPSSTQDNGGPPLEPRGPGRPGISTPELRERLLALLFEGLPLLAICRTPGMPSREAVYAWRRANPAFDRSCRFMADGWRTHRTQAGSTWPNWVARRVFSSICELPCLAHARVLFRRSWAPDP